MSVANLFNADFYLEQNPDVAAAQAQGIITAYQHFLNFGLAEGRSPFSSFDADFYLAQSPDVAAAVANGQMTAVQHFFNFGAGEVREFSPLFNLQAYLDANPDVADAVQNGLITAADHLVNYGIAEPRDLGNGVNLADFEQDPVYAQAIAEGNTQLAFARVAEVTPFLPDFIATGGWTVVPSTAIAGADFVVPSWLGDGVVQQIQNLQATIINSGLLDPDNLNPDGSGLTDPSALIDLIFNEFYGPGVSPIGIIGGLPGGTDFLAQ